MVLVAPPIARSEVDETQFRGLEAGRIGRIGLTVSRRVGGAVVRNRVKRRLREWFRTSALRASGGLDMVVIARPSAARLSVLALSTELEGLTREAAAGATR